MTPERGPQQWILDTIANRPKDEIRETILYHLGGGAPVEVRALYHSSGWPNEHWAELSDGRIVAIRRGEYFDLADRFHHLARAEEPKQ